MVQVLCTYTHRLLELYVCLQVNKTGSDVTIQPTTGTAANIVEADVPICNADMDVIDTLLFPSITALPASTRALVAGRTASNTSGR